MSLPSRHRLLAWVLLFAAAQGWVRLAVVPPWAHYDEPTHYEYVRFVVEHRRLPRPGEGDAALMARLNAAGAALPYTGHQFEEAPGYYVLQALVQGLFRPSTIAQGVALARAVSVMLAVLVAALAYLAVRQVFPGDSVLAAAVPALMATIVGYVDLMSAVSNDVGAVAAYSLVIAASTLMIRQGPRWTNGLLLLAAAASCVLAKSSALIGLPLAGLGLGLAVWPRLPLWLRWAVVAAGGVLLLLSFDLQSPAGWMRGGRANHPGRIETDAPLGRYAFRLEYEGTKAPTLWQALPPEMVAAVRGRMLTIGAWVRAPQGSAAVGLPMLRDGEAYETRRDVDATTGWAFYAYTVAVPAQVRHLGLYLPGHADLPVEYDGVLLTLQAVPGTQPPRFAGPDASRGEWGGTPFENLVTNGSAESGWPLFRAGLNRFLPEGGANFRLPSFYDWKRTWTSYWPALRWQFVSFWSAFEAGRPGLPVPGVLLLAIVSLLSGVGLVRRLRTLGAPGALAGAQGRALLFCGAALAAALVMSVLRIDPVRVNGVIAYLPTARHLYVAIVPAAMFIMAGWLAWWPQRYRRHGSVLLVLALFWLGVWSLLAVQLPYFGVTSPMTGPVPVISILLVGGDAGERDG